MLFAKSKIFWLVVIVFLFIILFIFTRLRKNNSTDLILEDNTSTIDQSSISTVKESGLPSPFPQDFPIYPGSVLTSSWTSEGKDKKGFSLVWESSDKLYEIYSFYKTELPNRDWKVTSLIEDKNSYTINFEKSNLFGFIGILNEAGVKTIISVTIASKKP